MINGKIEINNKNLHEKLVNSSSSITYRKMYTRLETGINPTKKTSKPNKIKYSINEIMKNNRLNDFDANKNRDINNNDENDDYYHINNVNNVNNDKKGEDKNNWHSAVKNHLSVKYTSGMCFGEKELLHEKETRLNNAIALEYTELCVLDEKAFISTFKV